MEGRAGWGRVCVWGGGVKNAAPKGGENLRTTERADAVSVLSKRFCWTFLT